VAKFRSRVNYAQILAGDKQGYNLGLDGSIFLRKETTPRVFNAPRIGTQGKSVGGTNPAASASTGDKLTVAVDGLPTVVATLASSPGSETAVAAAVELAINTALVAAGRDARVWAEYDSGADQYVVYSQYTGVTSAVVITDGPSADCATALKLGAVNGGTESTGTDDVDFLLYTTGGPTFSQPIESNSHRTGRYHTGIVKQKKVAEFDIDTHINMSGTAGASLDEAVMLLLEAALGKKTVNAGVSIDFEQDLPNVYMSLVRVSTIFGEYYTGAYVRGVQLSGPGDGPATMKFTGKAATASIAGIGQVDGAVSASADVVLDAGHSKRYTAGARVMAVDTDGRTITTGADGSLYVASVDDNLEKVVLSAAVTLADDSLLVPWHPGAVQQTGRDAIFTDLVGKVKLSAGGQAIDVTEWGLDIQNDHVDLDNRFGADANKGYAAGNRMTATLSTTFDLSNENFGEVVRTRDFGGFDPEITLGDTATGRAMVITAPKWIPAVPAIEVPESGTTPVTLEGVLYQSAPGARDPLKISFK
jgi:hypothetical protein